MFIPMLVGCHILVKYKYNMHLNMGYLNLPSHGQQLFLIYPIYVGLSYPIHMQFSYLGEPYIFQSSWDALVGWAFHITCQWKALNFSIKKFKWA
jgi:hypothetical protein